MLKQVCSSQPRIVFLFNRREPDGFLLSLKLQANGIEIAESKNHDGPTTIWVDGVKTSHLAPCYYLVDGLIEKYAIKPKPNKPTRLGSSLQVPG